MRCRVGLVARVAELEASLADARAESSLLRETVERRDKQPGSPGRHLAQAQRCRCDCGAVTAAVFCDHTTAPGCYGVGVRAAIA